ncbi:MAG: PEP-CTERM sorting domain-containing protein [Gemmatimonadaceae bacterium]|nr:PEP-CTERM sorting domain-containing protein [Gemmatimonadaceae bacterium]
MIRTSLRIATGLLSAAIVAGPAAAQSWQSIGTPSNAGTGAYWNNRSDDNINSSVVCNVAAILTNTPALAAGSCNNQGPAFLPVNPAPLTTSNVFLGGAMGANPGGFRFAAGIYNFGVIGRVAGDLGTSWGIITDGGVVTNAAALVGGSRVITDKFSVWITAALPQAQNGTVFTSDQRVGALAIGSRAATINQQFAVFTSGTGVGMAGLSSDAFGTLIAGTVGQRFFVGMEDNVNGGRGFGVAGAGTVSDRDYNDIIVSVQAVPEPSTYALLATGLLGLGVVARRRRQA